VPGIFVQAIAGFGAAAVVALLAARRGTLTNSGVIAAIIVGGVIVAAGGWAWGALLVLFFATSSALSLMRRRRRGRDATAVRGLQRDAVQVLANGGIATVAALVASFTTSPLVFVGFAGAIAAANADTWSTEIGALAPRPPRLITTGQRVPPGTSGGITSLGTLAGFGGSALIGVVAAAMLAAGWISEQRVEFGAVAGIIVGGAVGTLGDSILGATLQARYRCPRCGVTTERLIHDCGTATVRVHGWARMNNDVVNALATLVGALVAALLAWLF
jgi:uncharacterized protein (TIGR00297 family)